MTGYEDRERAAAIQVKGGAEPTAETDRGRHLGFARYSILTGGPGNLAVPFGEGGDAMRQMLMITIALTLFGYTRPPVLADEPLKPDLTNNVTVRLVAVRRSEARSNNLIAKFETEGKDKREVVIHFPPNQATPHERTLIALVEACAGGREAAGGLKWKSAEVEAVFSIPKAGIAGSDRKEYAKCYL